MSDDDKPDPDLFAKRPTSSWTPPPGWQAPAPSSLPPHRRRPHRLRRALIFSGIGLVALIVIITVISVASSSGPSSDKAPPTTPVPVTGTTGPALATPTTPSRTVAHATTLFQDTAAGTHSGPQFTTHGPWEVAWNYNCKAFLGGTGNFQVFVTKDSGDKFSPDLGVNQLGASGSGVEHYYDKGTFHLEMNSECTWGVRVTAAP